MAEPVRWPPRTPGVRNNPLQEFRKKMVDAAIIAPFAQLLAWILGGNAEDWDTLEEIHDNLLPALIRLPLRILVQLIGGIPVVGNAFEAALANWLKTTNKTATDAYENADTAVAQVNTITQVFTVRSDRPYWEGPDPTGESTFPWALMHTVTPHTHTFSADGSGTRTTNSTGVNRVAATASLLPMGLVKCEFPTEKAQTSFKARKVGTLTAVHVDLYVMNEDGSFRLHSSTGDVKDDLLTVFAWQQVVFPTPYLPEMGDWVGVQFRVSGSGSLELAGLQMEPENFFPSFRPLNYALMRTTNSAPATITRSEADERYTYLVPYVQIGSDVGQVNADRNFYDGFNRAALGNSWQSFSWSQLSGMGGGSTLAIEAGRLVNPSWQLVAQRSAELWTLPLISDAYAIEWETSGETIGDAYSGVILGSTSGLTNFAYCAANNSSVAIYTSSSLSTSATQRAAASVGTNANNNTTVQWRASYDGPVSGGGTNTFRVYRNGVKVIEWADAGNAIAHGKGNRFCGALITHTSFVSGLALDNWRAYDLGELAA